MKKISVAMLAAFVLSSSAFGQQQEEARRHSSGPRRQLATIVFAGLGGAILGLSTLSFYGRPQDQLSNIAIGFAVGVIAGTAYVTLRSATTRDYYDDKPPQTLNQTPQSRLKTLAEIPPSSSSDFYDPQVIYGPLISKVAPTSTAVGGLIAFRF